MAGIRLPQFLKETTLPWTLIGMFIVFLILKWIVIGSPCPAEGSFYLASPGGTHVAHRYYYGCGGATVGFTNNIDVDNTTVFSTYGGGDSSAEITWLSGNELQITYGTDLASIQTFEQKQGDVSVRFLRSINNMPITKEEIEKARKAAGY